jgi:biopolymer transport protein ExbB/TolQ
MNPAAKWTLITGGVLTLCGPVIGLLGTVISMMGSFKTLETSGVSDTDALASDISMTLLTTTGGIILGGIGVAILIVGLVIWLATRNVAKPPTLNL